MKLSYTILVITAFIITFIVLFKSNQLSSQLYVNTQSTIDSLTKQNEVLEKKQDYLDSILNVHGKHIDTLNTTISNNKEKITIIREYYYEKSKTADKYTPSQIDSFLKIRYKY